MDVFAFASKRALNVPMSYIWLETIIIIKSQKILKNT